MRKHIIYSKPDGRVAIITPTFGDGPPPLSHIPVVSSEEKFIDIGIRPFFTARVGDHIERDVAYLNNLTYTEISVFEIIDDIDIPKDYTLRNAWEHDTSNSLIKIKINITKAIVRAHEINKDLAKRGAIDNASTEEELLIILRS